VHESALTLQALQTVPHDAGVIHPIMDSEWVAPILLVPKKDWNYVGRNTK